MHRNPFRNLFIFLWQIVLVIFWIKTKSALKFTFKHPTLCLHYYPFCYGNYYITIRKNLAIFSKVWYTHWKHEISQRGLECLNTFQVAFFNHHNDWVLRIPCFTNHHPFDNIIPLSNILHLTDAILTESWQLFRNL